MTFPGTTALGRLGESSDNEDGLTHLYLARLLEDKGLFWFRSGSEVSLSMSITTYQNMISIGVQLHRGHIQPSERTSQEWMEWQSEPCLEELG